MTREELVKIMGRQWVMPQSTDDCFKNIATALLSAIEKERDGECKHNRIRRDGVEGDIGGRPWNMYRCENCGKRFDGELI